MADLTDAIVAETAEALRERADGHTLDRVQIHGRHQRYRIETWLEHDFAREITDRGRTRCDHRPTKSGDRDITRQDDDRTRRQLRQITPPDFSAAGKIGHEEAAASRNDAKSPHASSSSSG